MEKPREDLNKTGDLAIHGAGHAEYRTHSFQGHREQSAHMLDCKEKTWQMSKGQSTNYVLGIQHSDARNHKNVTRKPVRGATSPPHTGAWDTTSKNVLSTSGSASLEVFFPKRSGLLPGTQLGLATVDISCQ